MFQVTLGQRSGNRQQASLSLKKTLDYESKDEYTITIQVKVKNNLYIFQS